MTPDDPPPKETSAPRPRESGRGTERRVLERRAGARKTESESRRGQLSSGLALILASTALLVTGYLWYTLLYQRQDLVRMDVPSALATLERNTQENQQALADTEEQITTLAQTQETLQAALAKIETDLGQNRTEWMIAEAEQLLLIANRRLQLARDITSALAALRAADNQLELLANPQLLGVRRILAREIAQLESLERIDVAGISLKLGSLADTIDGLPLAQEGKPEKAQTPTPLPRATPSDNDVSPRSGWQFAHNVWRDLLSLVQIRRDLEVEHPLLPPEQHYFLRENLRLMLYSAQQALLQGHIATYQQNVKSAARWVKDYFVPDSPKVAAIQTELENLQQTKATAELPDISGSLAALRKAAHRRAP